MRNAFCVSALVLFTGCLSNNGGNGGSSHSSKNIEVFEKRIDSLYNQVIKPNEPGAAVLISHNGERLISKAYGIGNMDSMEPITPSTNMEIASISKQFTALSILSLVNSDLVSLETEITEIFPCESFTGVTIEQLINHTSGLADAESELLSSWDASKIASNEDILSWYMKENRKVNPPGSEYNYNNGAYEILPLIVEKISGQDFIEYTKEYVFEKFGMVNSTFFDLNDPKEIMKRASYYNQDSMGNWGKMDGHFLTGVLGAGGVYTNISDYFEYDKALRNKNVFSDSIHNLIFKPSSSYLSNGTRRHYAMGWVVTDTTATHTGGWFGVSTYAKRYLDQPLTIVIFMNRGDLFDTPLINETERILKDYLDSKK